MKGCKPVKIETADKKKYLLELGIQECKKDCECEKCKSDK